MRLIQIFKIFTELTGLGALIVFSALKLVELIEERKTNE